VLPKRITPSVSSWLRLSLAASLIAIGILFPLSARVAVARSAEDGFPPGQFLPVDPRASLTVEYFAYLPLVLNNFPFSPAAPLLSAVSNADGDGNYPVTWSSSAGANAYTLQEDDNSAFTSPTTAYAGSSASRAISGRAVGTYYYRVQASNPYASSGWSNTVPVAVTVAAACPQAGLWRGTTSQAGKTIEFVIENPGTCQIAASSLEIQFKDGCNANRTTVFNSSAAITNNHFEIEGASTQVTGDFSSFTTASGTFDYTAAGCPISGTWTADFNPGADYMVRALAAQADGKIVVGGQFLWLGGQPRSYIGRLNIDGSLDTDFNPGANSWVLALAVQEDGKILVGGWFTKLAGVTHNYIGRLNPDGTIDATFTLGANGIVNALAVQEDGKILVGGDFSTLGGETRYDIARLNPDGSLDTTFNPGENGTNWEVNALALQADHKIIVGGSFGRMGGAVRNRIARLDPEGTLDTTFNPGANLSVNTLAMQSDGKILVGGSFTILGGGSRTYIGRLNSNGSLDADFNPGAGNYPYALAVQADGKILVGGQFTTLAGEARSRIGRLNPDGTLDLDFDPGAGGIVYALLVQADGKIVAGGAFTTLAGGTRHYIGQLNPNGTLDPWFP
jgi:uncharacterized delta-60 repeat protein